MDPIAGLIEATQMTPKSVVRNTQYTIFDDWKNYLTRKRNPTIDTRFDQVLCSAIVFGLVSLSFAHCVQPWNDPTYCQRRSR
jgi:hypothetical protein